MVEHTLWHVSSAVIATGSEYTQAVLAQLEGVEGLEVHGHERGTIVVVIEGPSTAFLGEVLSRVSLVHGVVFLSGRKAKTERCSWAFILLGPEAPMMCVDNRSADRQAYA